MKKAILKDRLYIKRKHYKKNKKLRRKLQELFSHRMVDPYICDLRQRGIDCRGKKGDTGNDFRKCYSCPKAVYELNMVEKEESKVSIPRGNLKILHKLLPDFKFIDRTVFPQVKYQNEFFWKRLKDRSKAKKQRRAIRKWREYGYGQICAPPRSGKTVMAVALSCKFDTRIAVLAHQYELLDQFYNTFMNFTAIKDLSRQAGRRLIAINPKPEEVDKLLVCLYTYQQFITRGGAKKLDKIKDKFGLIIVDECHKVPAKYFSSVVDKLLATYRLGVTATPTRKDGLHVKSDAIIGPVVVEALTEQLPAFVKVVKTGIQIPRFHRWPTFVRRLSVHEERNKLIAKFAKKDIKAGHRIIIPVDRRAHAAELHKLLSKKLKNKHIRYIVSGVADRKEVFSEAKKGKVDILIATRRIVSLGLDLPPMSCIYQVIPIANKYNVYQEISRIRTPYKDKPECLIRYFLDDGSAAYACYKISSGVYEKQGFVFK